ncbi:MAG: DUF721 domain-containing protein [Bacteroidetes bacterium]|nr:DUF721 domain-containing protein [Bacteroidota bacterium]
MRKGNEHTIGSAIRQMMKENKLTNRLTEVRLKEVYETVMGQTIGMRTSEINLYGKRLVITISSAALKHEMNLSKEKIITLLNDALGEQVIEEVVIK